MTKETPEFDSFSAKVAQAVARIAVAREAAIPALYDLTAQRLLRLACTITRNQHDAEDVLQTVMVRMAWKPEPMLEAERPWSYLLQCVRNEALLVLRKRKSSRLVVGITDLLTQVSVDDAARKESHCSVWLAMRELPAEQAEVVVLRIWEQMKFSEIGEVLGLPLATVASRYRYALKRLAGSLRPQNVEVIREQK
ncbi:MAG: RNA polymerase sigma factor [Planctomycetales bacterium]|nr:RNA polymerase sigma factor [Planctomycetales bacterium]